MKKITLALAVFAAAVFAQDGFDYSSVQRDMLMGLSGNAVALKRAMEACEKALAANPNHAPALVYHGMGLLVQSHGDPAIFPKALAEMERAAKLDPDNLGVRIPRGSVLAGIARQMPDSPIRQAQMESALGDFRLAFDMQKDHLNTLGTHPLGELLQNLGDLYSRMDKPAEAQRYYELIQSMLPNSEYSKRAALWLETKQPLPIAQTACIGCHTSGAR